MLQILDLTTQGYDPELPARASPGPTTTSYTICQLNPGRQYTFGVSSRSVNGRSIPVKTFFYTEQTYPPKPETPQVIQGISH